MKRRISDMLDGCGDAELELNENTPLSSQRIKELTMKQVKKNHKVRRFGTRLLIAAAIITALAVPVMAVSGGWFADWLAVTKDYQDSLIFHWEEAEEKGNENWDVSGWFIEMWGEGATATGMTLVCNEFSNNAHGATLTTNEGYWIEKWNGTDYEKMEAQVPEGETIEIQPKTMTNWTVDWSDTYGSLESGYYRIAKTFTCGEETAVIYGTFRVFTEDMEPYIRKCNDSLAELLASDSWHMTWTDYRIYDSPGEFNLERTEMEIWRSGEDYLFMDTGYALDGSVAFRGGSMFREGFGYTNIRWAGDTVESEIVDWQNASYLDHSNFDLWPGGMNIWEDIVGQVCDNGNQIIVIEYNAPVGGGQSDMTKEEILAQAPYAFHDYTEKTFTFDENGELCRIEETVQTGVDVPDSEKVLYRVLEIHETTEEEIAATIKRQNLSGVKSFSYSKDYAVYQDMGSTDGFVNTTEIIMEGVEAVITRARQETEPKKDPQYRDGYIYNCSEAYYDSEVKMWKVDFWFSQDSQEKSFRQIVYLNHQGVTEFVVYPVVPEGVFGSFLWQHDYSVYSEYSVLDGFKNKEVQPVTGPQHAMELAYQEADPKAHPNYVEGATFTRVWAAFYDVEEDMWRVVMWCQEHEGMVCNVYLNGDGITQMVYYEDIP